MKNWGGNRPPPCTLCSVDPVMKYLLLYYKPKTFLETLTDVPIEERFAANVVFTSFFFGHPTKEMHPGKNCFFSFFF